MREALYSIEQIRHIEQKAETKLNISSEQLMQKAGQSAFLWIQKIWPKLKKIIVLCGPGNNGGDGYVVARVAKESGYDVTLISLTSEKVLKGAAKNAAQSWQKVGGKIERWPDKSLLSEPYDVIVDAILGTGLNKVPEDDIAQAIRWINQQASASTKVFSLDIPSGLNADTGVISPTAVKADATMTFIGHKQGMHTGKVLAFTGQLIVESLGLSQKNISEQTNTYLLTDMWFRKNILPRSVVSHKGGQGHVLVIGGDYGFQGAARMAAEAALRSGAGLVSLVTRPEHAMAIAAARPEIMCHGLNEPKDLDKLLEKATVVAIGPGMGRDAWGESIWATVKDCAKPMVVDADGLFWFKKTPIKSESAVLTPHPGEAAFLLESEVGELEKNRFATVNAIQRKYGSVTVLKGPGTLIKGHSEEINVCPRGNSGMAQGGFGDVLTGVIASLIAQKYPVFKAGCLGVYAHAWAADLASLKGEKGLQPTDVYDWLPFIFNQQVKHNDT